MKITLAILLLFLIAGSSSSQSAYPLRFAVVKSQMEKTDALVTVSPYFKGTMPTDLPKETVITFTCTETFAEGGKYPAASSKSHELKVLVGADKRHEATCTW